MKTHKSFKVQERSRITRLIWQKFGLPLYINICCQKIYLHTWTKWLRKTDMLHTVFRKVWFHVLLFFCRFTLGVNLLSSWVPEKEWQQKCCGIWDSRQRLQKVAWDSRGAGWQINGFLAEISHPLSVIKLDCGLNKFYFIVNFLISFAMA